MFVYIKACPSTLTIVQFLYGDIVLNLKDLGWVPRASDKEINTDVLARITSINRGFCKAMTTEGDINAYLTGRFHSEVSSGADKPATGDFIRISPPFVDDQNSHAANIEEILPRRSKISRLVTGDGVNEQVIVANVDYAFIVTSANNDFNINRLQRYVLLAKEGNVVPVILLSKIDLLENTDVITSEIKERLGDVETFLVSSHKNIGIDKIQKKLTHGITGVFIGSSGVGKSTIVNKLLDKQVQVIRKIRDGDSKGRHATTARELFFLTSGGMIIDTAGLREVQVLAGEEAITSTFNDISELQQNCRFSDCNHDKEPGCAVNEALANGTLDKEEYRNYMGLQKEAAYTEKKVKQSRPTNAKKHWKTINNNYKSKKKI
jgi:ribosome biogenesis GTPase